MINSLKILMFTILSLIVIFGLTLGITYVCSPATVNYWFGITDEEIIEPNDEQQDNEHIVQTITSTYENFSDNDYMLWLTSELGEQSFIATLNNYVSWICSDFNDFTIKYYEYSIGYDDEQHKSLFPVEFEILDYVVESIE